MSFTTIESSPMWADVRKILCSGRKPVNFNYEGLLHTEKGNVSILKLVSVDIVRDYLNNITDHIRIEFKIGLGDYVSKIYPYRNNLEFTFTITELEENSGVKAKDTIVVKERYKAIFLPEENVKANASEYEFIDASTLNIGDITTVKLELLHRSIEPLRIKTVHGSYKNITPKQLIFNLLGGESCKVLVDGKPSIDGIDIIDPDNTDVRKHMVIPHGTHITAIPTFLQEKLGGVYNAGIGTYLQTYKDKKIWFVYPLYSIKRFDSNKDRAIFYNVPNSRLPIVDRTYRKDGDVIYILANSGVEYIDSASADHLNEGVGFRFADARSYMKKPVTLTLEGPKASRSNLNHEVALEKRRDGLNYAPVLDISSNPYYEYTKVNMRNMAQINIKWDNANINVLHPGMPCKYVFYSKNKLVELKGTILRVQLVIALQGNSITGNVYKNSAMVTIATTRYQTSQPI